MELVRCSACGREVRLWATPIAKQLSDRAHVTDDAAVRSPDGTFECPFCGTTQPSS
jgi:transcription elongation factor Elf1